MMSKALNVRAGVDMQLDGASHVAWAVVVVGDQNKGNTVMAGQEW